MGSACGKSSSAASSAAGVDSCAPRAEHRHSLQAEDANNRPPELAPVLHEDRSSSSHGSALNPNTEQQTQQRMTPAFVSVTGTASDNRSPHRQHQLHSQYRAVPRSLLSPLLQDGSPVSPGTRAETGSAVSLDSSAVPADDRRETELEFDRNAAAGAHHQHHRRNYSRPWGERKASGDHHDAVQHLLALHGDEECTAPMAAGSFAPPTVRHLSSAPSLGSGVLAIEEGPEDDHKDAPAREESRRRSVEDGGGVEKAAGEANRHVHQTQVPSVSPRRGVSHGDTSLDACGVLSCAAQQVSSASSLASGVLAFPSDDRREDGCGGARRPREEEEKIFVGGEREESFAIGVRGERELGSEYSLDSGAVDVAERRETALEFARNVIDEQAAADEMQSQGKEKQDYAERSSSSSSAAAGGALQIRQPAWVSRLQPGHAVTMAEHYGVTEEDLRAARSRPMPDFFADMSVSEASTGDMASRR
jgi:hypothetical protein